MPSKNTIEKRKQNLIILYEKQKGLCCYCNQKTILNISNNPPYLATLEHLLPKGFENREDIENQKMCCKKCNVIVDNWGYGIKKELFGKITHLKPFKY